MALSKKISLISGVVLLLSAVTSAQAEEQWPRWYLGLAGGVGFATESDLSGSKNGDLDYDLGTSATAALGYLPFFNSPFLDNMRTEAQFGYQYAGLDRFTNAGVKNAALKQMSVMSYMGNVYYDFNNTSQWTPYVGAGLGAATVGISKRSGLGNTSDKDTVLAYQLMMGLTYAPESIPMTEWGVGYRYLGADSPEYRAGANKLKLDDVSTHNIEATARFRF